METENAHFYRCLAARDSRFDGMFFVGVTSTGIYCRPVCSARTPKSCHCRYFKSAAEAETGGFRPCLKCRPELAPGLSPMAKSKRLACVALKLIQENHDLEAGSISAIATRLGISDRHLRRILKTEFGVTPHNLAKTHRLLQAKRLLTESTIPLTEIAFASGFQSVRSFNHLFKKQYGLAPSSIRKNCDTNKRENVILNLTYRPPFAFQELLAYLGTRALEGIEHVTNQAYYRTVSLGNYKGWIKVYLLDDKLKMEFAQELLPVLSTLLNRVTNIFDLDSNPDLIDEHLGKDPVLGPRISAHPGLRLPGCFDPLELSIRAIAGQSVSVKAATSITKSLFNSYNSKIETELPTLTHLVPSPSMVANSSKERFLDCGFTRQKTEAIISLAAKIENDILRFDGTLTSAALKLELEEIKGIGPWTASYIAMRALKDPNSFPYEDLVLQKALATKERKKMEAISSNWQPWRSYAAMYLWQETSQSEPKRGQS